MHVHRIMDDLSSFSSFLRRGDGLGMCIPSIFLSLLCGEDGLERMAWRGWLGEETSCTSGADLAMSQLVSLQTPFFYHL